jgi:hypothetical protein
VLISFRTKKNDDTCRSTALMEDACGILASKHACFLWSRHKQERVGESWVWYVLLRFLHDS